MNRGILILGIVGIVFALANAFAAGLFAVLTCFDSCSSALSIARNAPLSILAYFVWLAPALTLILAAWIWQIVELRRMGARGMLAFAATFPIITVVVMAAVTLIAAASAGFAPLAFTPLHLWTGEFGLAVWPLLVSIVAFVRRQRTGAPGAGSTTPPNAASAASTTP